MSGTKKNAYFRILGAPLKNPQWSWGARADSFIVLQVWEDRQVRREDGRWALLLGAREGYAPGDRHGSDERYAHVKALWSGGIAGYAIVAVAKDASAMPRATHSFRDDGIFALERLEFVDGDVFGLLGKFVLLKELAQHRTAHRTLGGEGGLPLQWATGPLPIDTPTVPSPSTGSTSPPMLPSEDVPSEANAPACDSDEFLRRQARFALTEQRPGQAAFRLAVYRACAGRCVVSGCDVPEALEAAHLHGRSWRLGHNKAEDGVLLRRDLHALYDSHLLELVGGGAWRFSEGVGNHYAALASEWTGSRAA